MTVELEIAAEHGQGQEWEQGVAREPSGLRAQDACTHRGALWYNWATPNTECVGRLGRTFSGYGREGVMTSTYTDSWLRGASMGSL